MEAPTMHDLPSGHHAAHALTQHLGQLKDSGVAMSNRRMPDRIQDREIGRRALLAALAASPFVLSACSAGSTDTTTSGKTVAPAKVDGDLNIWMALDTVNDKTIAKYKAIYLEPFEKQYPNVNVDAEPQNGQGLSQKLQTALSAGQGPDIIPVGSQLGLLFGQAGYLADLGPLAKAQNWDTTFLPWALDVGVVDDKLVSLPISYETLVLYYNKTLFETNGWTVPTDRAAVESLASQMSGAGVIPFTNANADYAPATEHVLSCYFNMVAGPAKLYSALTGEIAWTDPAFVSSMQMMIDDFNKGWFSGGVKQYLSTTDPEKYANMANGDTAMFLSGTWEIFPLNEYFKDSDSEWDWVPLPSFSPDVPPDVYPLALGDSIAINSDCDNLPAAEAYLTFSLTDADARWNAVKEVGDEPLPIVFDPAAVPDGIDPRFVRQYEAISKASEKKMVGYVTWTSFGSKAEAYLVDNQDKMLTGDLSAEDFCSHLNDEFKADFDKGLIPPAFATSA
jgi:raffinose/stachyose/melibiose transport system substrate-binding protein